MIYTARVYEKPPDVGASFLVDRLWPRGIKRETLNIKAWLRDVAPSDELRHWFQHDPSKWDEFKRRYFTELDNKPETWQGLLQAIRQGDVTLLYGAKDKEHNNAVALKSYLEAKLERLK